METRRHPIFSRFTCWEGEADGRTHYDFLGVRTDPKYWKNIRPQPAKHLKTGYPIPLEQYFEWIFLLETVFECKEQDSFTVAELGAGYGPWIVRAYKAFRQFSDAPIHLIAVEGDYNHYLWSIEHLRNNGIDPQQHTILHGCMTAKPTVVRFLQSDDPGGDYAQRKVSRFSPFKFDGKKRIAKKVRGITIAEITEKTKSVDLIHVDIQGAELDVIKPAIEILNQKVARMIIGTHSAHIERNLRKLLTGAKWESRYDFSREANVETEWGQIQFRDGCQAWTNPRLITSGRHTAHGES